MKQNNSLAITGLVKRAATTLLGLAFLAVGAQSAQLDVVQVSWTTSDGRAFHPSSDSGEYVLTLESADLQAMRWNEEGQHFIAYLNVAVNGPTNMLGEWVVRNYPVVVDSMSDLLGRLPVAIPAPLPCASIETLDLVGLTFSLTDAPVTNEYVGTFSPASVRQEPRYYGGLSEPTLFMPGLPSTEAYNQLRPEVLPGPVPRPLVNNMFGGLMGDNPLKLGEKVEIGIKEKDVAPVNEKCMYCTPGSMARSLRYMADNGKIKLADGADKVSDDIAKTMRTTNQGTNPANIVPGANAYIVKNKLGIKTRVAKDAADAEKALGKGADVTMHIMIDSVVRGRIVRILGHSVFVSAMTPVKDGANRVIGYIVEAIDDPTQGDGKAANRKTAYHVDFRNGTVVTYDENNRPIAAGWVSPTSGLVVKE